MGTFENSESKVLSFMEAVEEERKIQEAEDAFRMSDDYKLKVLNDEEKKAKDVCLNTLLVNVCKDATPLSPDYKTAYNGDLDKAFSDFIQTRCPNGIEFYVKEAIKRGSPFAKRVMEAVNDLVNKEFNDKSLNVDKLNVDDLVFKCNDDNQKKINIIGQELELPEIAEIIKDNVKNTALSEIERAKKNKEDLKNLESELANDVRINNQEALESALEFHDVGTKKDYKPSLFNAVMINKINTVKPLYEAGEYQDVYLYDALEEYGHGSANDTLYATPSEIAFVEAVTEYTGLSVLKALKLESFDKRRVDDLAYEYAKIK